MIGGTCKRGNALSGPVLIARGLDFEHRVWSYGVLRVRENAQALTTSAVIAAGKHLFPFRTEKLSPLAPMVLGGQPPGRVGSRRLISSGSRCAAPAFLYCVSRLTRAGGAGALLPGCVASGDGPRASASTRACGPPPVSAASLALSSGVLRGQGQAVEVSGVVRKEVDPGLCYRDCV